MFEQQARSDFERATWKAFWNSIVNWMMRRPNTLLPYDELERKLPTTGQRDRGVQTIELDQIAGSVGRYRDFDRAFLPTQRHTRDRWINIDKAHHSQAKLPPIDVYQIGDVYFVKDGNHRVSVAKERGQAYIDAYVVQIDSPIEITPDTDLDMVIRQIEKVEFFRSTHLDILRPGNRLRLTLPGQYEKLLEHIHVHRWYLGIENQREMAWDEAVQSWYDTVYMPIVNYIRDHDILADFPDRTETDLYLWLIEHQANLRDLSDPAPLPEAAEDFVSKHSDRPLKKAARAIKNTLNSLTEMIREGDKTDEFAMLDEAEEDKTE
jgi:uncharacterized ParB-like nuclease family protein